MTSNGQKSSTVKAREERLKAALRSNLQRRKAQARVRDSEGDAKAAKPQENES